MLDFFNLVLPANGYYVLTIGTPKRGEEGLWFRNYRYNNKQDLAAAAKKFDSQELVTYYALGAFKDNEEYNPKTDRRKITRAAAQAVAFHTFAFDIDLTKKVNGEEIVVYQTAQDAARALIQACGDLHLPVPYFMRSGRGVHAYYPLTADISTLHWRRASETLRLALVSHGMEFDTSKICDPSMVLRPLGTHNRKGGQLLPVRWAAGQSLTPFEPVPLIEAFISAAGKKKLPATTVGSPRRASAVADAVLNMDYPPAAAVDLEQKCLQIGAIAASGGNVAEPLWYAGMGIAAYCEDSEDVARKWSMGHPKYSEAETLRKLTQWKAHSGPTTCGHFEKLNPGGCSTCPHKGRIGSPVQLSVSGAVTFTVAEREMQLPKNYVEKGGRIFRVFEDEMIPVSDYLIYPSRRYKDEATGKSMCLLQAKFPMEGWKTLELEMDVLGGSSKDFSVWAVNHQLFISNEHIVKNTRQYIMTYLQELQLDSESEVLCGSFGWLDDMCDSFVLGDRLIKPTSTESVRLGQTAAQFAPYYSPRGDLAKWSALTSVFDMPQLEFHGLCFLMGMGSPLMMGSGLKSVLVNMYSAESGTGKSTTGAFVSSIYGHPDKTKLTVEDTQNATFKTMGVYGNLPVYIDEITTIESKQLGKVVYFLTQGREKKRMTKLGGFQESAEWENLSLSSSNHDMYDKLADRMSVEGESMRVLQFMLDKNPTFSGHAEVNYGYHINRTLTQHYGVAGEPFVRSILTLGGPHAVFERAFKAFDRRFDFAFTGKERFWKAAMVLAFASGEIGRATGLLQFDHVRCIESGLAYIKSLRTDIDASKLDCFDIIGTYLSEHMNKTVVWGSNLTTRRNYFRDPLPVNEVAARIEYYHTDKSPFVSGKLHVNQTHFNRWCHERGVDRRGVFAQLVQYGVTSYKDRRMSLMRGTTRPMPAVRAYEIILQHPRFVDIMQQNEIGGAPPDLHVVADNPGV